MGWKFANLKVPNISPWVFLPLRNDVNGSQITKLITNVEYCTFEIVFLGRMVETGRTVVQ